MQTQQQIPQSIAQTLHSKQLDWLFEHMPHFKEMYQTAEKIKAETKAYRTLHESVTTDSTNNSVSSTARRVKGLPWNVAGMYGAVLALHED